MTVTTTSREAGPFPGDGVTTALPFSFKVFAASDLLVERVTTSGRTELVLTTDYAVTLNADQNVSPGGVVNLVAANPVGADTYVSSDMDATQLKELTSQSGYYPKIINDAFDKATILVQQLKRNLGQSLRVSGGGALAPLPPTRGNGGKYLALDGAGNPVYASGTGNDSALRTDLANPLVGPALIGLRYEDTFEPGTFGEQVTRIINPYAAPFGLRGEATYDNSPGWLDVVDYALNVRGGGIIEFGSYAHGFGALGGDTQGNGLVIPYTSANSTENRLHVRGGGRSTLFQALDEDMILLRLSDSNCMLENFSLQGTGLDNVTGLALAPESRSQTTQVVNQNKNIIKFLYFNGCTEDIYFRTGPAVAGTQSGCWLNKFFGMEHIFGVRGVLAANCMAGASGSNRNVFFGSRIGQGYNTAVEIEDGDTIEFYGLQLEDISNTTGPNAVPTGIIIHATGASGLDNNNNAFYGGSAEGATRPCENHNPTTILDINLGETDVDCFPVAPAYAKSTDISLSPEKSKSFLYQESSQIADYSNAIVHVLPNNGIAVKFGAAFTFTGDEDTGMRRGGANRGQLFAGGLTKLEWNATGVGVGIEPDSLFQVAGGAGVGGFRVAISGTSQGYMDQDNFDFRTAAGSQIVNVSSAGFNLASGKTLRVDGQQVVGSRGASLPADATDLATAIALVNAIKARGKATGGHGLWAD